MTYNFDLCKACIILKENQEFSDRSKGSKPELPPPLAENEFSAKGGEGRSGYEVFAGRRKGNGASFFDDGQAGKSARGMPWHQEPKKDVTSCEKPRGGANIH